MAENASISAAVVAGIGAIVAVFVWAVKRHMRKTVGDELEIFVDGTETGHPVFVMRSTKQAYADSPNHPSLIGQPAQTSATSAQTSAGRVQLRNLLSSNTTNQALGHDRQDPDLEQGYVADGQVVAGHGQEPDPLPRGIPPSVIFADEKGFTEREAMLVKKVWLTFSQRRRAVELAREEENA